MVRKSIVVPLTVGLLLLAAGVYADTTGYGLVESFGDGKVVVRLENSTGTWTVDKETKVTGAVMVADWVYVNVETSGHVKALRVEEVPTPHSGVVKEVKGDVLLVRSGNGEVSWNVTQLTMLDGIERGQFQPGDEIGVKLYKNHNLAALKLIKRGVKVN
ncbi:MAG TPA: hypothetical protein VFI08_12485 [Spirochaetia bacterium]|nr:hypothetical protein [Spirochaetia bacterium]